MPRFQKLCFVCLLLVFPTLTASQGVTISVGGEGDFGSTTIQLFLLISVLSLAPGIVVTVTCFPFLITVFSILRQALGLQQSPPNMLLVSLALFLTFFIMEPALQEAWTTGFEPFSAGELTAEAAFVQAIKPFREFMMLRVDPEVLSRFSEFRPSFPAGQPPLTLLVPSFILSEISLAFQIGFLIFLPFLLIDLVVAAVLMSMGMMMVPPAIVSLPFKLAFFVVADGWSLLAAGLLSSYS